MKNEHKKNLDRRDFLKVLGGAAAVTSATLLPGCKNKQESAYTATTDIPTDQMTYQPKTEYLYWVTAACAGRPSRTTAPETAATI